MRAVALHCERHDRLAIAKVSPASAQTHPYFHTVARGEEQSHGALGSTEVLTSAFPVLLMLSAEETIRDSKAVP